MSGADDVRLDNWRTVPYSHHAFRHVDTLVDCARMLPGDAPLELPQASLALDLQTVCFEHRGRAWSVDEALREGDTDGLIVLRHGQVLGSYLGHGQTADCRHIVFSVSKSITGALAGVLVEQGLLDPQRPVSAYLSLPAGSAYADCTVRHVLDMTVAIRFVEDYLDPLGDVARYRVAMAWNPLGLVDGSVGLIDFVTGLPRGEGEHGQRFHYVSPNSDLLGRLLEVAGGAPVAELIERHLWQPMGAQDMALITLDHQGAARTAGGICCTLGDMARFGELMRNEGRHGARQVIPAQWVRDIRSAGDPQAWAHGEMTDLFPEARYRSQWYSPTGADEGVFCAIGIHGQWIWIDPARGVVIAKQSSQATPADDDLDALNIALFRTLSREVEKC
ncbi:serine hydrolase domain-containing protein [Pseudomonas sp. LRF_L74]|uniref:serine hydrolase domain-containing protein n=1 Tax=Pseudomonas sp. LRF_L74 TaxID=3369422 RepID=UPI003F63783E